MPSNVALYFWVPFSMIAAMGVYLVMRQRLPLKLNRFRGREVMPLEEIHKEYYSDCDQETFLELWTEISSAVGVRAGLIRPTDRFDGELGPVKGFEIASEMDDLNEAIIRRCKERHLDTSDVRIGTVDDYIRTFSIARSNA